MSGGSWDYLFTKCLSELEPSVLRAAAKRLCELGDYRTAGTIDLLVKQLSDAEKTLSSIRKQLHDMEWVDSNDMSADDYRKENL